MTIEKRYAICDIGGCVIGTPSYKTSDEAQAVIDGLDYLGAFYDVAEVEVNTEELSEAGQTKFDELMETLKNVSNIHMSLGPGFFKLSADEKITFFLDLFTSIKSEEIRDVDLDI